jgi:hypothetical protein
MKKPTRLQMSGVPSQSTPHPLVLSFMALIEREVIWCEENPDSAFSDEYRKGFINGLVQSRLLVSEADRLLRESAATAVKESK